MITGGSSGLGKAVAAELLSKGAHVTLMARNMKQLQEAAQELSANKVHAKQLIKLVSADVTDYKNFQKALNEAEATLGPVQMLFCCAGNGIVVFSIVFNYI